MLVYMIGKVTYTSGYAIEFLIKMEGYEEERERPASKAEMKDAIFIHETSRTGDFYPARNN